MDKNENRSVVRQKKEWVAPEVRRLNAGSAESLDGMVGDGGGGAQGS